MSGRLSGKVALVTGASRGIGAACATALAAEGMLPFHEKADRFSAYMVGATVAVNYNRDAKSAEEIVSKIGAERAVALQADVGDVAQGIALVAETVKRFGKIDILVLNAALVLGNRDMSSTSEEDFDTAFRVNVKAPFFLTKVCCDRGIFKSEPTLI
jgi:3-oxoacyl-[acyl-carrier protein] reductase